MEPSSPLAGLVAREALGRIDAVAAALTQGAATSRGDAAWAAEALTSLTALLHRIGVGGTGELAAAIDVLRSSDAPDARRAAAQAADDALGGLHPQVEAQPGIAERRTVTLEEIVRDAAAEATRVAIARGVRVVVDPVFRVGGAVPPPLAGPLVDVLGQVVRDSVTNGTVEGARCDSRSTWTTTNSPSWSPIAVTRSTPRGRAHPAPQRYARGISGWRGHGSWHSAATSHSPRAPGEARA